ncbi:Radical_SAM domain-containing protein [Tenacibaculum sp. 190130A14a]|uniref:Radical_SAM domain-containing protein n=1 Tax=Tenacibaculum polynesiense TaxID=3137857 RepID=A0ABM9P6R3_9FLAO
MEQVVNEKDKSGIIQDAFDNSRLNLIIFPTEQCNFRCTYCYEDFKIGNMKSELIESIKKLVLKRAPQLKSLEYSWFGGEPLLAFKSIIEILEFTNSLTEKYPNFSSISNITTNAYSLSINRFIKLVSNNVKVFQISLDGDSTIHDKTRLLKNGNGTFEKIWNNLKKIKETTLDFEIILRIHFHPRNAEKMESLVSKLNSDFNDERFKFYFKAIEDLGGENSKNVVRMSPIEKNNIKKSLESLVINQNQIFNLKNSYVCYASKPNSLAIRGDGTLAKCTVALDKEENKLGKLNLDGTLDIDTNKLKYWMSGFEKWEINKLACPHKANEKSA